MKDLHYAFVLRRLATILAIVILTLSLTTAFTGVLLAFYYEPTAGGAYNSLKAIAFLDSQRLANTAYPQYCREWRYRCLSHRNRRAVFGREI